MANSTAVLLYEGKLPKGSLIFSSAVLLLIFVLLPSFLSFVPEDIASRLGMGIGFALIVLIYVSLRVLRSSRILLEGQDVLLWNGEKTYRVATSDLTDVFPATLIREKKSVTAVKGFDPKRRTATVPLLLVLAAVAISFFQEFGDVYQYGIWAVALVLFVSTVLNEIIEWKDRSTRTPGWKPESEPFNVNVVTHHLTGFREVGVVLKNRSQSDLFFHTTEPEHVVERIRASLMPR